MRCQTSSHLLPAAIPCPHLPVYTLDTAEIVIASDCQYEYEIPIEVPLALSGCMHFRSPKRMSSTAACSTSRIIRTNTHERMHSRTSAINYITSLNGLRALKSPFLELWDLPLSNENFETRAKPLPKGTLDSPNPYLSMRKSCIHPQALS